MVCETGRSTKTSAYREFWLENSKNDTLKRVSKIYMMNPIDKLLQHLDIAVRKAICHRSDGFSFSSIRGRRIYSLASSLCALRACEEPHLLWRPQASTKMTLSLEFSWPRLYIKNATNVNKDATQKYYPQRCKSRGCRSLDPAFGEILGVEGEAPLKRDALPRTLR